MQTQLFQYCFLARLFFKEKKSRYCHHSGVVVCIGGGVVVVVVVVVVTNFNLGYNFLSVEANLMKLHLLVHHHKGYNLTKTHYSARLFDKIVPRFRYAKLDHALITGVSIVCDKDLTAERWPPHAGLLLVSQFTMSKEYYGTCVVAGEMWIGILWYMCCCR